MSEKVIKGVMKIGDHERAILQLQASQADPLNAIKELINNSIDGHATKVMIIRQRRKNGVELIIDDNGDGVAPDREGEPDLKKVVESICKSDKALLTQKEREEQNIVGQFAIGLIGFASVGKFVEVVSKCDTSDKGKFLYLKKGSIDFEIGSRVKINRGTFIRIFPIHDSVISRITAEKLNYYLSDALSGRLEKTTLIIADKIRKKTIEVRPRIYRGERIKINKIEIPVKKGKFIDLELYVTSQEKEGSNVAVFCMGTKILKSITEIEDLNKFPWNSPFLEGKINDSFVNIPPTTRYGIIHDDNLIDLIRALNLIEDDVAEIINEIQTKKSSKEQKNVIKGWKDLMARFSDFLPPEYDWFNSKSGHKLNSNIHVSDTISHVTSPKGKKFQHEYVNEPLAYLRVVPRFAALLPNEKLKITVTAWTKDGKQVPSGIQYYWEMKDIFIGHTEIDPRKDKFYFTAGTQEGKTTIRVNAVQMYEGVKYKAKAKVEVAIVLKKEEKESYHGARLPIPQPIYRPGEKWRSRWNVNVNTMEYNTGHPDYIEVQKNGNRAIIRYISMLFVKHLVIQNFKDRGEEEISERILEAMILLDRAEENGNKK